MSGYQSDVTKTIFPNIMVYDLETGGFSKDKNPIIEFAGIMFDSEMNEIDRLEFVILPYDERLEYTDGAFKANGFSHGEIQKRGIPGQEAAKLLLDFLVKHQAKPEKGISYQPDKKVVLAGHNIDKFDNGFLETFLKFFKVDLWKFCSTNITLDTLKMARLFFGYRGYTKTSHSLIDCCSHIGIEIIDAHRAMNDVEGNFQLLKHLINGVRFGNSNSTEEREVERFRNTFKIG